MVKEVTAGAANKADLNVKEPVGTWPLMGDAVPRMQCWGWDICGHLWVLLGAKLLWEHSRNSNQAGQNSEALP